jgi:hypothetical protein
MNTLLQKYKALNRWKKFIIVYLTIGLGFGIHHYFTYTCTGWFCFDSGLGLFIGSILMVFLYPLKFIIALKLSGGNL